MQIIMRGTKVYLACITIRVTYFGKFYANYNTELCFATMKMRIIQVDRFLCKLLQNTPFCTYYHVHNSLPLVFKDHIPYAAKHRLLVSFDNNSQCIYLKK
jgi:hypothetical protein